MKIHEIYKIYINYENVWKYMKFLRDFSSWNSYGSLPTTFDNLYNVLRDGLNCAWNFGVSMDSGSSLALQWCSFQHGCFYHDTPGLKFLVGLFSPWFRSHLIEIFIKILHSSRRIFKARRPNWSTASGQSVSQNPIIVAKIKLLVAII